MARPGPDDRAHWSPRRPPKGNGRRVGLLGGSFNPAHDGHLYISREALRRLDLDEVWWLVSPQNPLKSRDEMAPLARRYRSAIDAARDRRIRVTDIETKLGTTYTAETLDKLVQVFPRNRFVWLMGADNLAQIPDWRDWPQIFNTVAIAVFARGTYSEKALSGAAAARFAKSRVAAEKARSLPARQPPAWCFIHCRLHPASATAIRQRDGQRLL